MFCAKNKQQTRKESSKAERKRYDRDETNVEFSVFEFIQTRAKCDQIGLSYAHVSNGK